MIFYHFCDINDNASIIMEDLTNNSEKIRKVYVRPILNYKQIVEIIDRRISEIERAAEEFSERNKQRKKTKKDK